MFMLSGQHHHHPSSELSHLPKLTLWPHCSPAPGPDPTICFCRRLSCLQGPCRSEIIRCWGAGPSVWLFSFSVTSSRFIRAVAGIRMSVLPRPNDIPAWTDHISLVHPAVHTCWSLFHLLAPVTVAALNVVVPTSLPGPSFYSFGYLRKAELLGHMGMPFLLLARKFHGVVHSGRTSLHPHQQHTRVPASPYPCQYLFSGEFLAGAVLLGARRCVVVGSALP